VLTPASLTDVVRTVAGCLRATSADNLPILAGIQPAELRRTLATLSLACRAMALGHLPVGGGTFFKVGGIRASEKL